MTYFNSRGPNGLELMTCSIDGSVGLLEFSAKEIGHALSKDDMVTLKHLNFIIIHIFVCLFILMTHLLLTHIHMIFSLVLANASIY